MNNIFTKKQNEYIEQLLTPKKYNFQFGATGSGKTHLDIVFTIPYFIDLLKDKEGIFVIIGVSEATIVRNILEPMQAFWGDKLVTTNVNANKAKLFNQTVYIIGAEKISQIKKFRGTTIKFAYGDEVAEWNAEVFGFLGTRLRVKHSVFCGTFNPDNQQHFLRKFLLPTDSEPKFENQQHTKYTLFDNTFLDKQTVADIVQQYQGTVYYDRYVMGNFADAEGLIYPNFNDNHILQQLPEEIANKLEIFIGGIDIGGSQSATVFTLIGVTYDYKTVVVLDEIYIGEDQSTTRIENAFKDTIPEWKKNYPELLKIYIDSECQTFKRTFSSYGFFIQMENSKKNKIIERIRATNRLIGLNRLYVMAHCKRLIESFRSVIWKPNQPLETRLDDGTYNIDSLDSFEYALEPLLKKLQSR